MRAPWGTRVTGDRLWPTFDPAAPMGMLNRTIHAPMTVTTLFGLWREQRTADLSVDGGIRPWGEGELRMRGRCLCCAAHRLWSGDWPGRLSGATQGRGQSLMQETSKAQRHHQKEAKDDT